MLKLPNMLLIGSSGRKAGKTKLASTIIHRFGNRHRIIGIKITVVHDQSVDCPMTDQESAAFYNPKEKYRIREEQDSSLTNDTSRMLASGAFRVFWLKVRDEYLKEGFNELLLSIGSETLLVCESTSLRNIVEPGLFLIIKDKTSNGYKPSALKVKAFADKIVTFDGRGFDISNKGIEVVQKRWILINN
ncbi:hypothetical protein ACFLRM_06995 [Acidobacteriota bacterium]